MSYPDISIITVVLNDMQGLKNTIDSIQKQTNIKIEHIIVDGGSTDGSQLIASEYSTVQVVSQKDGGIYQGMQRGAELATSKYLMFVNSSDQLLGSSDLCDAVHKMTHCKSLWGFGPILENTLRSTTKLSGGLGELKLSSIINRKTFVPFPVVVIDQREFFKVGGFNYDYKIAGDFDLIVRLAKSSSPTRWSYPLVLFSAGGISYTKPITAWREEHLIRVRNLDMGMFQALVSNLIFIKRILRWVLGKLLDFIQSTGIFGPKHWRDKI
jgi:glycosyltransferase involved in cell wall biosynthesis